MPDSREKIIPQAPSSIETRVSQLEDGQAELKIILTEIRDAVVGKGGLTPGLGEEVRALKERVAFLFGVLKWGAGIGTTAVIGLWAAWLNSGRPGSH